MTEIHRLIASSEAVEGQRRALFERGPFAIRALRALDECQCGETRGCVVHNPGSERFSHDFSPKDENAASMLELNAEQYNTIKEHYETVRGLGAEALEYADVHAILQAAIESHIVFAPRPQPATEHLYSGGTMYLYCGTHNATSDSIGSSQQHLIAEAVSKWPLIRSLEHLWACGPEFLGMHNTTEFFAFMEDHDSCAVEITNSPPADHNVEQV